MLRESLESTIVAVTVFREGAQVERKAILPEGITGRVKIAGLPLILDDGSVSVSVDGPDPKPVIVDFQVGLEANSVTEYGEVDQRLEETTRRLEFLKTRRSTLERLRRGIELLSPRARPQGSDGSPAGSYQLLSQMELLAFYAEESARLDEELASLFREMYLARQTVEKLEAEKQERARGAKPGELEKVVYLTMRGTALSGTALSLVYRVTGAKWAPSYVVNFSRTLEEAQLTMRALVTQNTGEDWEAVKLTLSTADPQVWREVPEWKALRIGQRAQTLARRWFPPPTGAETLFLDFDRAQGNSTNLMMIAEPPESVSEESSSRISAEVASKIAAIRERRRRPTQPESPAALEGRFASEAAEPDNNFLYCLKGSYRGDEGGKGRVLGTGYSTGIADSMVAPGSEAGGGSFEEFKLLRPHPDSQNYRWTVSDKYLRYQSLRMVDFNRGGRGRLVPLSVEQLYCESRVCRMEVMEEALQSAATEANLVKWAQAPRGHHFPRSLDGFDYAYRAQAPVDLPSSKDFHNVALFALDLTPKLEFVCTPRYSDDVFRMVTTKNPSAFALPAGPADISIEGEFLHTTPLRNVPPGGLLKLGLGVDQSIKLSRTASFSEGTSGLLGGTTELVHTIHIDVVNHRAGDLVLEIRESLPEPMEAAKSEAAVRVRNVRPTWERYVPDSDPTLENGYRWRLPVAAGGAATATATYVVEIPSKYEIQGGNRREPSA